MYIIYLYPIYISCPAFQKFFPKRAAACMLRPYCYLLFVICYDCARKGPPRRGDQTCVTTLLLFVICYDCACRARQMSALVKEKMFHGGLRFHRNRGATALVKEKMFHGGLRFHRNRGAIQPQSRCHRMPIAVSDVSRGVPARYSHAWKQRQQACNSL